MALFGLSSGYGTPGARMTTNRSCNVFVAPWRATRTCRSWGQTAGTAYSSMANALLPVTSLSLAKV